MRQGDEDWWRLAETIANEDIVRVIEYNGGALAEHRLDALPGPVPCVGAIMTAPVVMLLSHPVLNARSTSEDFSFRRSGWPLSALHPDAPRGLGDWWRSRVAELIDLFGRQHVSNSVAAAFLTPWRSAAFDDRLRLPSRQRMLGLAASAAARDAILLTLRGEELWTEHSVIAALPRTHRLRPKTRRLTELSVQNLGDTAWTMICKRIEVHAWT
ncbi:MAG TPA: hypothetical protein VF059_12300 [Casimicrobiaceae bacterium]